MKRINRKLFKIELCGGIIRLDRGAMGAALIEKKLNIWIDHKNYEDLGMYLVYGWEGYQHYSDDELIDEVYEYFYYPDEIRKLLKKQRKRLKIENAQWKKEGEKFLKEILETKKKES